MPQCHAARGHGGLQITQGPDDAAKLVTAAAAAQTSATSETVTGWPHILARLPSCAVKADTALGSPVSSTPVSPTVKVSRAIPSMSAWLAAQAISTPGRWL